jgi:Mn-dependent DtxR family transcriptional regulator
MVGVILVVAMLITPPSTAILWSDKLYRVIIISSCIGLASAIIGFYGAVYYDTTPGPAMAISAALCYTISVFVAPDKGIIARRIKRARLITRIKREDILKEALRSTQKNQNVSLQSLRDKLNLSARQIERLMRSLQHSKYLDRVDTEHISLTASGISRANGLMRAHRLWETYLVDQIGLTEDQIHDDAENLEHHLTDDILDEVDVTLGFPSKDPHGSPIPRKTSISGPTLFDAATNTIVTIAGNQKNAEIITFLWESGLTPGSQAEILEKGSNVITLLYSGQSIEIPVRISQKIGLEAGT